MMVSGSVELNLVQARCCGEKASTSPITSPTTRERPSCAAITATVAIAAPRMIACTWTSTSWDSGSSHQTKATKAAKPGAWLPPQLGSHSAVAGSDSEMQPLCRMLSAMGR